MNDYGLANTIKVVVIVGLVTLDMVLAHYLSGQPEVRDWGVLLAALPMAAIGLLAIRRFFGNLAAILGLLALAGLLFELFGALREHVSWIYFLQHVTINLMLGIWFGRSLLRQREPLCTTFAHLLHPVMHEQLRRYTYRLTQIWTLFFFAMAATSILLFLFSPVAVWSTFANLLTLPLVALLFLIEYIVRIRVLPPEDHLGLTSAFRAYRRVISNRRQPATPLDTPLDTSKDLNP